MAGDAEQYVRAASLRELADGGRLVVEIDGDEILLARIRDEVFAVGNICTHEHVWLDDGHLHPETWEIECPMHEGRFDLRTGEATHLPCEEPLPSYAIQIDGDDIFVAVRDS